MLKAGKVLKTTYRKLLHVTCIILGINRVAEVIRSSFGDVDALLAALKKVFKKAPSRTAKFKKMYPNLCLPLESIPNRWGSWLKVVEYYTNNLEIGGSLKLTLFILDEVDVKLRAISGDVGKECFTNLKLLF
jgi:hypothetical protein